MILAVVTMVAAQAAAATAPSGIDGLALFQQVCIDGGRPRVAAAAVSFASLPAPAHATLARLNNAYETLDSDGGVHRAVAFQGGDVFLITPAPGARAGRGTAPSCIVLWRGGDAAAARAFHPPYAAHVALQSVENDGWFLLRAIPADPVAAPPG